MDIQFMKAITLRNFGNVDNFELVNIQLPSLRKGEVRIRIKAVSFNPIDYQIRKGLPEGRLDGSNILGRDLSGIIVELGENVRDFQLGDAVICYVCNLSSSGTYAEYVNVPADLAARKPVTLSHEQSASIPVAGITAWLALHKVRPDKSKSIFIAGGAGGVGSFTLLFAKYLGISNIITTAGNEKSLNYLMDTFHLRKDQIINYRDRDFVDQALKINKGDFDIVMDFVGGKMLSNGCKLIAIDGNIASITEAPTQCDFELLFNKNVSFHSIGANAYSLTGNPVHWVKYKRILNTITKLFDGNVIAAPKISIVGDFSLETVKNAHNLLENNLVQGKLIMRFN